MRFLKAYTIVAFVLLSALNLIHLDSYAQEDILQQIEAELEAEKEKQKALEKAQKNAEKFAIKYRQTINKADALLKGEKFDEAIEAYQESLTYKPDDEYAPKQLKEAKRLKKQAEEKAKKLEIQKEFQEKIDEAKKAFEGKNWDDAIRLYEEAKKVKPDEPLPAEKIAEARKLKKKEEEERKAREAAEALQKEYDELMDAAAKFMSDEAYDDARSKFEAASKLKPAEQEPKNKILECDKLKAEAIAKKKQAELQEKYDAIITEADDLLKAEKFDEARAKYDAAIAVLPNEKYPHEQVAKCDQLKKEFIQKQKDEQYQALVDEADGLLKDQKFDEAKLKYEESLKFKPADNYAQNQVLECDKQKKAFKEQQKSEAYQALIDEADDLLKNKAFDEAKLKYEEALKFKPADNYAQSQVIECDKQKKAFAEEKLTAEFNEIIKQGDELLEANKFDEAIQTYDEAHKLMPDNPIGPQKVEEAGRLKKEFALKNKAEEYQKYLDQGDKLLTEEQFELAIKEYAKAEQLFPDKNEAQERIKATKQKKAELEKAATEEKYFALIEQGDEKLKEKQFEEARTAYTEAEKILPDHQEAKTKVHELNLLLENLKAEKKQAQYDRFMEKADSLLSAEEFDLAEENYRYAHQQKPSETLPNTKIQECHKLKKQKLEKLKQEASAKEKEEKYSTLMSEAQGYHQEAKYQKAINTYHLALEVYANDEKALAGIDESKAALKKQNEEAALAAKEIAHKNELKKQYDALITSGEQALQGREFATAKEKYQEAGELLPEESAHLTKLAELQKAEEEFIAKQKAEQEAKEAALAAQKSQDEEKKEMEKKVNKYEGLLDKGNNALASENFQKAIEFYTLASQLLPEDERAPRKLKRTKEAQLEKEEELMAERRKKKAAEAAASLAVQAAAEAKRKEKEYEDHIDQGKTAMNSSKFEEAIKSFEAAEAILSGRQQTADFLQMAKSKLEKQKAEQDQQAKQERFENYFKAAETAFKSRNYDLAFTSIEEAKKIKPEFPPLLTLEKKVEKQALKEEERMARQMALQKLGSKEENSFSVVYLDPKRRERLDEIAFVHDLATKYPEGLTVQYRTDDRKEVEVRIVVQQTLGAEYQKVTHSWGGTYYFKNGKSVSSYIWQKEAGGL